MKGLRGRRWAVITSVAGTVFIAAGAFWLSFTSLADLARRSGIGAGQAWAWPLIVDGVIVVSTVAVVALAGKRAAWYPWALLVGGAAVSVTANSLHAVVAAGRVAGDHASDRRADPRHHTPRYRARGAAGGRADHPVATERDGISRPATWGGRRHRCGRRRRAGSSGARGRAARTGLVEQGHRPAPGRASLDGGPLAASCSPVR